MTMQIESPGEVLGLTGEFPRPGWVVLDAIRERRFTGEVVFATAPESRVYSDLGRIYLAERVTEPSLGARLVDAGVLNAAQLERGALRVGDGEHLGRLFERVPSVDRHSVIVVTEMMTEECVGWIAAQRISEIEVTPYRHHASGVHRWDRPFGDLVPGDPLPAPAPDASPVDLSAPEPLFTPIDAIDADPMIKWNEPSWLDERPPRPAVPPPSIDLGDNGLVAPAVPTVEPTLPATGDEWIDQLDTHGLPDPDSDPLAFPVRLPGVTADPVDRFEMIWPSGEVDEQFGIALTADDLPNPDNDRVGPTARMVRDAGVRQPNDGATAVTDELPIVPDGSDDSDDGLDPDQPPPTLPPQEAPVRAGIDDDVLMAVRRAVASIETGSLAARRRIADASNSSDFSSAELVVPARLAVRSDNGQMAPTVSVRTRNTATGSVFDDMPIVEPAVMADPVEPVVNTASNGVAADQPRVGALRRLIGSLRGRR